MPNKINLRLDLFWKELVLFGLALSAGIFSASRQADQVDIKTVESMSYSWENIIVFFIFLILISLLLPRFNKLSLVAFKFFLVLVVFSGSQAFFETFISSPLDLLLALGLTICFVVFHSVLIHNLGIIIGIAGISSLLGLVIKPELAIGLLVILSFYDILAVYWTGHMVTLARGMMESGAIFGFIIPFRWLDIFYHKYEAKKKIGERFMILGSGDVGLPLILISSVAVNSVAQATIIAMFASAGLFVTHLLFVNQSGRRPMAALPPIATFTIIGYLVFQLW